MSEEDLADVVSLYPERDLQDDDVALVAPRETPPCNHRKTRLDSDARRVYCRECDREVDAFTVLKRLAGDTERWITFRKEAERRATAANERLQEILRLERNARSRLKKLDPEASPPPKPWGDGSIMP